MAGNYKRTVHYPGKPDLSERVWKSLWLQPHDDSRVPREVYVFEDEGGWTGYYQSDPARLEIRWIKGLWKEVPSPFGDAGRLVPVSQDDDETTQEEMVIG